MQRRARLPLPLTSEMISGYLTIFLDHPTVITPLSEKRSPVISASSTLGRTWRFCPLALFQICAEEETGRREREEGDVTFTTPFRDPVAIFRQGRSMAIEVISSPSWASRMKNTRRPVSISHAPILELFPQVINWDERERQNVRRRRRQRRIGVYLFQARIEHRTTDRRWMRLGHTSVSRCVLS